jgi:hypothetical protein
MGDEVEMDEEQGYWSRAQKPLPLQRILQENGQNRRNKAGGKVTPPSPKQSMYDKENVQSLTKITEKRLVSLSETSDWIAQEALSSTLAVHQTCLSTPERLKPALFSASNLSSISLLVNASNSPQDCNFKTPNRREGLVNSGVFSSGTPSSRTPSSRGTRTPSTDSSERSGIRYNPFDSHRTYDSLQLPTLSPSVFNVVSSPSTEDTVNGRFWSIEQQAELYPTVISEDSPHKQSILHRNYREEQGSKAQEQIEIYFQNYHDITSPPELPPTGPLLVDSPDASYTHPESGCASKWTQTCITLPPVLPPQVEQVLRQFNFITDISEEPNNLSNSTLRRKLFNVDMFSDESQQQSSSEEEEEEDGSPCKFMGKILRTPVTLKDGNSAQWSSSPVRTRIRNSFSPPDQQSPMFSPIAKGRASRSLNQSVEEEEDDLDPEPGANRESTGLDRSELYQTAELLVFTEPSEDDSKDGEQVFNEMSCMMDTDSNSGAGWGLTLPSIAEDSNMNTESRIDTGYTTNTLSSIHPSKLQESSNPSTLNMDSGVSTSQQPDLTVSLILPQPLPTPLDPVLISYAAEATNDISVGFPLGSSTPTRR